jgi:hypothetical protein
MKVHYKKICPKDFFGAAKIGKAKLTAPALNPQGRGWSLTTDLWPGFANPGLYLYFVNTKQDHEKKNNDLLFDML